MANAGPCFRPNPIPERLSLFDLDPHGPRSPTTKTHKNHKIDRPEDQGRDRKDECQ